MFIHHFWFMIAYKGGDDDSSWWYNEYIYYGCIIWMLIFTHHGIYIIYDEAYKKLPNYATKKNNSIACMLLINFILTFIMVISFLIELYTTNGIIYYYDDTELEQTIMMHHIPTPLNMLKMIGLTMMSNGIISVIMAMIYMIVYGKELIQYTDDVYVDDD